MKLKKAAQNTAALREDTVETIVAIELATSCRPEQVEAGRDIALRKSKTRATTLNNLVLQKGVPRSSHNAVIVAVFSFSSHHQP